MGRGRKKRSETTTPTDPPKSNSLTITTRTRSALKQSNIVEADNKPVKRSTRQNLKLDLNLHSDEWQTMPRKNGVTSKRSSTSLMQAKGSNENISSNNPTMEVDKLQNEKNLVKESSDVETEVLKVVEIIEESQISNLDEDSQTSVMEEESQPSVEEEDCKEYELVYVEDDGEDEHITLQHDDSSKNYDESSDEFVVTVVDHFEYESPDQFGVVESEEIHDVISGEETNQFSDNDSIITNENEAIEIETIDEPKLSEINMEIEISDSILPSNYPIDDENSIETEIVCQEETEIEDQEETEIEDQEETEIEDQEETEIEDQEETETECQEETVIGGQEEIELETEDINMEPDILGSNDDNIIITQCRIEESVEPIDAEEIIKPVLPIETENVEIKDITIEKSYSKELEQPEIKDETQEPEMAVQDNLTVNEQDSNCSAIELKFQNIQLTDENIPDNETNTTKITEIIVKSKEQETDSSAIESSKSLESEELCRNIYAEAFAGLSNETKHHIFEAFMRSKSEILHETNFKTKGGDEKNKKESHKNENISFDEGKNMFVKNKKSKKLSKSKKKSSKDKDSNEKSNSEKGDSSIRRSNRIKTISQSRQRSHGHGLVKDKHRFLNIESLSELLENEQNMNRLTSELDSNDQILSPAIVVSKTPEEIELELKLEKEMIKRLAQFTTVKENIYHCDKNISKEAKKMTCDCFLTKEEIERGELGCGEDCLNRLLMIECSSICTVSERCTNRRFQKTQYSNCKVVQTEKKGFGIIAADIIPVGEFIMEYVGEVLNSTQFEKRADEYSKDKNKHYYFMSLRSDAVIDATSKGNISRFINHSCDPNAETQKWTVNGELRIGFFSSRTILKGEEITFDYQFQRYGKEAQKCFCEASNCRGWIGEEPDSGEDEDDDEDEDEEVEKIETNAFLEENIDAAKESVFISAVVEEDKDTPVTEEIPKIVKKQRKKKSKTKKTRAEIFEDADLDDEIDILNRTGLKNQQHTLKLSRLMVRAKLMSARLRVLELLQNGEMPCRRLFLDYHGLRLLYGWMCESVACENLVNLKFQINILETLKALPIPNKTMLKDSKVLNLIHKWASDKKYLSDSNNDDTPSDSGSGTPQTDSNQSPNSIIINEKKDLLSQTFNEISYLKKSIISISIKLKSSWENLPEVFRIPKKERIEQMKEHEREADLRCKALGLAEKLPEYSKYDRYRERKELKIKNKTNHESKHVHADSWSNNSKPTHHIDKYQRRQMFEMQFAKEQEEKRKQEIWKQHEMTCNCFGLDPRQVVAEDVPAMVNPATGQWYTADRRPVTAPPSHAHIKPPEQILSTNPDDYNIEVPKLPPLWKYAIDTKGRIYYYHTKIRISQWEPPIFLSPLAKVQTEKSQENIKAEASVTEPKPQLSKDDSSSTDSNDSSEDELQEKLTNLKNQLKQKGINLLNLNISENDLSMNDEKKVKENILVKCENNSIADPETFTRIDTGKSILFKKHKMKKRREGLVQERIISPRAEEDKIYGQQQSRLYRETKEKLRKRKEEMRKRKLLESSDQTAKKIVKLTEGLPVSISPYDSQESDEESCVTNLVTPPEVSCSVGNSSKKSDPDNAVDFVESLISINMSDNDARLLDGLKEISKEKTLKKNVYEEWKKQQVKLKNEAKRKEMLKNYPSPIQLKDAPNSKKRKLNSDRDADLSMEEAKRIKEKFRTDIAGVIVQHLGPYRKDSCTVGRIIADEDFKHLARKLTHFVMLKELKHCDNTVNILEVTDSVKIKSREFIKKYMAKYGSVYKRGENEPDFRD